MQLLPKYIIILLLISLILIASGSLTYYISRNGAMSVKELDNEYHPESQMFLNFTPGDIIVVTGTIHIWDEMMPNWSMMESTGFFETRTIEYKWEFSLEGSDLTFYSDEDIRGMGGELVIEFVVKQVNPLNFFDYSFHNGSQYLLVRSSFQAGAVLGLTYLGALVMCYAATRVAFAYAIVRYGELRKERL